jgi:tetratricopeptide (TPR) repeat protein
MQRLSWKIITLHAVLIFVLFPSCMPQKKAAIDRAMADRTRMEIERTRMESEQYVVDGDYKSAMDVYTDANRKHPKHPMLSTNYQKTIEDIHRAADEAFTREDFASSGRAYFVLLKNYPYYQELILELSFDKGVLHARLEDCSSHLSQRALADYRKGNLAEAISIWKSILAFDPNNSGIAKAIDTATIQLKNLQQKRE